jgi:uncharacterized damage-inducible protein DinB
MKKLYFFLAVVFMTTCFAVKAQSIPGENVKESMIKDWERAKKYTQAYLDAMPADKYGKKPTDSIRSFSEQMLHLASGNVFLASKAIGKEWSYTGFNMERSAGAQKKDSVAYYVNASYDYVISGIKSMDPAQLTEQVKWGNWDLAKVEWLMKTFEHQTHHRGQCTIYIRLAGVKPPNEMLF